MGSMEPNLASAASRWAVALLAAACTMPAAAGVYIGQQAQPLHPGFSYQGVGGRVDIPLCPDTNLRVVARNVAAKYNRRSSGIGNLTPINSPEYPPPNTLSLEHVVMHEVGHALGLAHPNEELFSSGGRANAAGIAPSNPGPNGELDAQPGPDGVFGSEDDLRGDDVNRTPFPLSNNNSPFEVPAIVDDLSMSTDLSRRIRPGTWAMVPWKPVAQLLGLPDTQSVMMSSGGEWVSRPSPDEITLLKWIESGADGIASTIDDYQLFLYVVEPSGDPADIPPNCVHMAMAPINNSTTAGQTQFITPYLEGPAYSCFGSALCLRRSAITINANFNWHYPTSDTSNGEADYIPLAASDVVFTAPAQVEVNQGVLREVTFQVARQGGEEFPPGTQLTVTATNGVLSCVRADDRCSTQFDLSGKTLFDATVTVDGDGTPSSGAIFINVFVPNRDVARGRITVVDLAETLVLDFVPARVQLRTTGLPDDYPGLKVQWEARLRTSSIQTAVAGANIQIDSQYATFPDNLSTCRLTGPRSGISVAGPYFLDNATNAMGEATIEMEYLTNQSGDPVQAEAQCRFTYQPSSGPLIEGFMSITTDQVLASLTPNRTGATLRSVVEGAQEAFVFTTLDQLGQPLAEGRELTASCTAPAGNQVRFAPMAQPTVDATGAATLTVQASTADGTGFVEEVTCSVSADGVSRDVTIAPVLPAELVLSPESVYVPATDQVVGLEINVTVRVNDAFGDAMEGVPVSLSCPQAAAEGVDIVPVLPTTRSTDTGGLAQLSAAIVGVGRAGLATPVECSVSTANLFAPFLVEGQPFAIFRGGFEAP